MTTLYVALLNTINPLGHFHHVNMLPSLLISLWCVPTLNVHVCVCFWQRLWQTVTFYPTPPLSPLLHSPFTCCGTATLKHRAMERSSGPILSRNKQVWLPRLCGDVVLKKKKISRSNKPKVLLLRSLSLSCGICPPGAFVIRPLR